MGKTKAQKAAAIRAANPLPRRDITDPLASCNVCGQPSARLGAWQAHDERDQPMPMPASLVFIGKDHDACQRDLTHHPRLYAEVRGDPGHFPFLCGPCPQRDGLACRHSKLKTNGGPGLLVKLSRMNLFGAIICPPPRIVHHAYACEGRPETETNSPDAP